MITNDKRRFVINNCYIEFCNVDFSDMCTFNKLFRNMDLGEHMRERNNINTRSSSMDACLVDTHEHKHIYAN